MYKTINKYNEFEFTFKHSKFIGYVMPVSTEEEAIKFIKEIKSKNKKATHNTFAYRLKENNITRYSDDGEPTGTAGMPILNVITSKDLFDVCIVVTRYFGGILLGTGGLVHCYSKAANDITNDENILNMVLCNKCIINCEYNVFNNIQSTLIKFGCNITNIEYNISGKNIIHFNIITENFMNLSNTIREISSSKIINELDSDYYGMP